MANMHKAPFRVAIAQVAPVFLDRAATLEKACELIVDAGQAGARLIVFPGAFLPGYPTWIWSISPDQRGLLNELRTQLLANAVSIPSDTTDRLCRIAQRARINVVIGISECDTAAGGATYFNTLLYIDARGQILGKHRLSVLSDMETRLLPGDSVVVNPNGEYIAGPVPEQEMLLYADIDLRQEHR